VLLPLIGIHGVQSGAVNGRCTLGQTRDVSQCTPTLQVSNTHRIISHRHMEFGHRYTVPSPRISA